MFPDAERASTSWQNETVTARWGSRSAPAGHALPDGAARALVTVTERPGLRDADRRGRPWRSAGTGSRSSSSLLFTLFVGYRAGRLLTSDHTSAAFANARELWHWSAGCTCRWSRTCRAG